MSRGRRHTRWAAKTLEHGVLQPDVPPHAVRAFRSLPLRRRLAIVEEIVATRRYELCRAFVDVVDVAEGFRHRGCVEQGTRRVVREPCVTFVVREKKKEERVRRENLVPSHLLTFATIRGARILCAVPTDVEDGRERAAVRPQGQPETIAVTTTNGTSVVGAIACVITRTAGASRIPYAMSCKHVFSLSEKLGVGEVVGARVAVEGAAETIGKTLRVSGRLSDEEKFSLDSQLAEVTDPVALVDAIATPRPARWAKSKDDILLQPSYLILTPREEIKARPKELAKDYLIDYGQTDMHEIRHRQVVLSNADAPTYGGDSGSPVVTKDYKMLLGMHIAGNEDTNLCVMIPAWALLSRGDYQHTGGGETWALW